MNYIAYFYDINNNVVAQVEDILDLQVESILNDVSSASFALFNTNPYCKREFIKSYRRVKINLSSDNSEDTLFDGVIRWFPSDLTKTTIQLKSFEHLLKRRKIHQDYNYTNTSINTVLSDILLEINTRYETNITLDCWITDLVSPGYKDWQDFLSIIKDLAGNWYEFIVDDLVLKFKTTVWVDRSSGADFVEYRLDSTEPSDRTIDTASFNEDGELLVNWVIAKSGSNYNDQDDLASIAEYWLVEDTIFVYGDVIKSAESYIADHKNGVQEFEISATTSNFFEAFLGDFVKVYIFVGNDIMFFDGPMKITKKRYTAGDLPLIEFSVGITKIKTLDPLEKIKELGERINKLEVQ